MHDSCYTFDLQKEQILTRADAARHLGRLQKRSKPIAVNQVTRWFHTGIRGIALPSLLVGQRRITTVEAIDWWLRAVSAATPAATVQAPSARPADQGRRSAAPLTAQQRATLHRAGMSTEAS